MNRECYHQREIHALLHPEGDFGLPMGWVKSVDLACTRWLHERGLGSYVPKVLPGAMGGVEAGSPTPANLSSDVESVS